MMQLFLFPKYIDRVCHFLDGKFSRMKKWHDYKQCIEVNKNFKDEEMA